MVDMDMSHFHTFPQIQAADGPRLYCLEDMAQSHCLVTDILRDFIQESPGSARFLSEVILAMDTYQHHAAHIALGAIAELVRVGRMDAATRSAINDIIHSVNQYC